MYILLYEVVLALDSVMWLKSLNITIPLSFSLYLTLNVFPTFLLLRLVTEYFIYLSLLLLVYYIRKLWCRAFVWRVKRFRQRDRSKLWTSYQVNQVRFFK